MSAQLDLLLSRAARDQGMARVDKPVFTDEVLSVVASFPSGSEWTGEDIRAHCEDRDIVPHHPNAWGAAVNCAVRRGLLAKTGEYRQMQRVSSHARVNPVYRRTGGVAG